MNVPIGDAITVAYVDVVHAHSELIHIDWENASKEEILAEVLEAMHDMECAMDMMKPYAIPTEEWRVIGWTYRYEISSLGRVRSRNKDGTPKILKQVVRANGYPSVTLCVDGKSFNAQVSHLVAAAFFGERPEGLHVCHNDGNTMNNSKVNLRYDTPKANAEDKRQHGTLLSGSNHPRAILSEDDVRVIRHRHGRGDKQIDIASDFGISKGVVSNIVNGRSYVGVGLYE